MNALVVDDSAVVRSIIERVLKPLGYGVYQATNGQEALESLTQIGPSIQLMLLDWNMPVRDGYETIKEIKANAAYKHICIIMVSTESEDEKIDQVLEAGANGYLAKPFSEQELTDKINATLNAFQPQ